MNTVH